MTIPNLTLRNGSTVLPLVPSDAYDVITFDTGYPALKPDVQAALEAGERVADGDWHEPCERGLSVAALGATDEAAEASANALVALLRKYGTVLEVAGSEPLSTTVRSVEVRPREWDATTLIHREQGYIALDIDLVTDPYWYGAEVDASGFTLTAIPAQFAYDSIPGEVPALTRIKFTCDDDLPAAGFIALGLRSFDASGDASGYDCIDDYSGASDANALGGEESAAYTMTSSWGNIATPPDIDTAVNEGRYALFARVESSAATATVDASTDYRAVSSVTGSSIAATTTANGDSVDAALGTGEGFEVKPLGELNVPAGAIPDVATGSGWSDESSLAENTVEDGTSGITLTAEDRGLPGFYLTVKQTFASFTGQITAIEYRVREAPSTVTGVTLRIYDASDVLQYSNLLYSSDMTVGLHKITLPAPVACVTGATWYFVLEFHAPSTFTVKLAFSNGDYAAGALTTSLYGSGESAGDDLTFKVYGQTALGFNSSIAVQATSTESSKTAQVDYLVRVPTDEGYVCITRDFAAGQGAMVDESSPLPQKHNIYLCDADGIGPSLLAAATEWRGSLMLRPGYNVFTAAAYTPVAAAPGGGSVNVWYRPRYLTCGS